VFRRVLAPVDFSNDARLAARLAWMLTDDDGELELLHVDAIPELTALSSEPIYVARRAWKVLREQHAIEFGRKLEEMVGEIAANAGDRAGPSIDATIKTGEIEETICQEARGWPADLMVIGAHGESGSVRYLFGSTAAKLSRMAPCPVLVSRPDATKAILDRGSFNRVLVAVDHSPFSPVAVMLGRRFSRPGQRIHMLHVWHPPPGIPLQFTGERRNYEAERMTKLATALDLSDREVEPLVDVGQPAVQLLNHAERCNADLIVVGAHGRENLVEKVIGTTSDRILRHAKVPVLVVPEPALGPTDRARAREARLQ
jgi:nucleotide-binding universal stress UspA family protein